jgi:hypothetical protein
MSTLAILEKKALSATTVFASKESLSSILMDIRGEVCKEVPDLSTAASRKRIASLAYKVSKSKTALDELGKQLVAEWKAKSAAVDKERKRVRDELDALRDEVRKPLTDWESEQERIEAERIAIEAERIAEIKAREDALSLRESAFKAEQDRIERDDFDKAKEEAERLAIDDAARKASAAPDKDKIIAYVETLRDAINNTPSLTTDAQAWLNVAVQKLTSIVDRIDQKAGEM